MSKQRYSFAERHAYWEAFGRKCAYCDNAIESQLAMEIDHVLNEARASRPAELKEVLDRHGLPETFDLGGRLNRVCACKRCNSKKGADRPIALIEFGLKAAKEKTPDIEGLLEKHRADAKVDDALSRVGSAVESGRTTREYVAAFLEIEPAPNAPRNVLQESEILRILGNASTGLLDWPQRSGGTWLERPELDSLLARLDRPHSFTVLLGEPGSGKSALLAHVAEGLSKNGVALLALKADLLPPDLGTLAALDEYLRHARAGCRKPEGTRRNRDRCFPH